MSDLVVDRADQVGEAYRHQGAFTQMAFDAGHLACRMLRAVQRTEQLFQAARQQDLPEPRILARARNVRISDIHGSHRHS